MNNKSIWLPHLILQRGLGVKDLDTVNFRANLVEHKFGDSPETWQPKEDKPNLQTQTQAILDPKDPRLDNERGQIFDKGGRDTHLVEIHYEYDRKTGNSLINSIALRGEKVEFQLLGYNTYLFQTEYDLIKDVIDKIEEISIQVTYGLSPLFKVYAKLKEES